MKRMKHIMKPLENFKAQGGKRYYRWSPSAPMLTAIEAIQRYPLAFPVVFLVFKEPSLVVGVVQITVPGCLFSCEISFEEEGQAYRSYTI